MRVDSQLQWSKGSARPGVIVANSVIYTLRLENPYGGYPLVFRDEPAKGFGR